jgi:hypothetical protein
MPAVRPPLTLDANVYAGRYRRRSQPQAATGLSPSRADRKKSTQQKNKLASIFLWPGAAFTLERPALYMLARESGSAVLPGSRRLASKRPSADPRRAAEGSQTNTSLWSFTQPFSRARKNTRLGRHQRPHQTKVIYAQRSAWGYSANPPKKRGRWV